MASVGGAGGDDPGRGPPRRCPSSAEKGKGIAVEAPRRSKRRRGSGIVIDEAAAAARAEAEARGRELEIEAEGVVPEVEAREGKPEVEVEGPVLEIWAAEMGLDEEDLAGIMEGQDAPRDRRRSQRLPTIAGGGAHREPTAKERAQVTDTELLRGLSDHPLMYACIGTVSDFVCFSVFFSSTYSCLLYYSFLFTYLDKFLFLFSFES